MLYFQVERRCSMSVRLVAVDLDGTALSTRKELGEKTLSALRTCGERGIYVAVATARSERNAAAFLRAIRPRAVISSGGALARVDGETVYRRVLPAKTADALTGHLVKRPDVRYVTLETDSGYFVNYPREDFPGWEGTDSDFSQPREEDALKVMADFFPGGEPADALSRFPDCAMTSFAGEGWVSFSHPQAAKHLALAAALARLGVEPGEAAAFGDDINDLGMLTLCGTSVAMENAIPALKEAAGFICPGCDEDGVGQWLWTHILKNNAKEGFS